MYLLLQLKGSDGALGFYKLLVKLVAQKPMEFFKSHKDWLGGNGTEKPINATIFPSLIRKKIVSTIKYSKEVTANYPPFRQKIFFTKFESPLHPLLY